MARKSRKEAIRALNAGQQISNIEYCAEQNTKKCYSTIGYARLSVAETRDRKDSEALQNQKTLLRNFIQDKLDLHLVEICEDNGETGTNFNRPGFEHMMEQIRAGKADCVVVKDLSRFGRDYIEAGNYLEHIFPHIGVRFISISDGYDSMDATTADCLTIALKNLVNQMYSMDISRKSGSVLREKMLRGEFIGGFAAYGYIKDPQNKHHIIVDPETAPVVREIFRRKLNGASNTDIVRWLNEADILSPGCYRYQRGIILDRKFEKKKPWISQTVVSILRNQVYTGDMVQGRRRSEFYAGKPELKLPKEDWCIVSGTHEPIVAREEFDAVQEVMNSITNRYNANLGKYCSLGKHDNILKGLVFCGDCGKPLVRHKDVIRGKYIRYSYFCRGYSIHAESNVCSRKHLREDALIDVLTQTISVDFQETVDVAAMADRISQKNRRQVESLESERRRRNGEFAQAEAAKRRTMEDYLSGKLSLLDFERLKGFSAERIERLRMQIAELEAELKKRSEVLTKDNLWLKTFGGLNGRNELTDELAHTLIHRINVYDYDRVEVILRYRDEREEFLTAVREERTV